MQMLALPIELFTSTRTVETLGRAFMKESIQCLKLPIDPILAQWKKGPSW